MDNHNEQQHKMANNGRNRKCTCGEMFVSEMDLNEHIQEKTQKETSDTSVKTVNVIDQFLADN